MIFMLNIDLQLIKDYLWITDNTDDVRLQAILDTALDIVQEVCGDIGYWEKTQKVNKRAYMRTWKFTLNIIEPEKLLEVNWVDYSTKTNWVEYYIDDFWDVFLRKHHIFNTVDLDNHCPFFVVKYVAWLKTAPKKLIWLLAEYIDYARNLDWWLAISHEQLWPRSVSYGWVSNWRDGQLFDLPIKKLKIWLQSFIPIWLRIF